MTLTDMVIRKKTKQVNCGGVLIGGGTPVSIQSMTNTDTRDIRSTLTQIQRLKGAGCRIVRVAVSDSESVEAFREIRRQVDIPLSADIQFDYRLAVACVDAGADKIRINPGNIGGREGIEQIVKKARERRIPIRVGVNSGSIEKDILEKYGGPCADGLAESALRNVKLLEELDFYDIVVSAKASDVVMNFEAYRLLSEMTDYPLHIGVTESGDITRGTVKSSVGLGALLLEGIGDTIRVSLTGDPVAEIPVAREILKCTGNLNAGIDIVSCPTCSRCSVDLAVIVDGVVKMVESLEKHEGDGCRRITVAVMGCAVNGPGEAKNADVGVACGGGKGLIFKKGSVIKTVNGSEIERALMNELQELYKEYRI